MKKLKSFIKVVKNMRWKEELGEFSWSGILTGTAILVSWFVIVGAFAKYLWSGK